MRHYIDPADLTRDELMRLIHTANEIIKNPKEFSTAAAGKIIATLFFEPSTRTRLSFESAMLSLGGSVITVSGAEGSSAAKGESLADTLRMVTGYADICALRHPRDGAAYAAANASGIPVINAGDGGHFHPTQTLTDLFAIHNAKGRLGGITVGCCGDLKYGRTVHSLVKALSDYEDVKFIFISCGELGLPQYVKSYLSGGRWREVQTINECIGELDVLYMTRVQRERMSGPEEYERVKDFCVLDAGKLKNARRDLTVLHPLPRLNEISTDIDGDPRAYYFQQARGGRFIRMALIKFLLENSAVDMWAGNPRGCGANSGNGGGTSGQPVPDKFSSNPSGLECANENCITKFERGIKNEFELLPDGNFRCRYCDKIIL